MKEESGRKGGAREKQRQRRRNKEIERRGTKVRR